MTERDVMSAEIERLRHELADAHGVAQACELRAEAAERERNLARIELNRMHNNELPGGWTAVLESERLRRLEAERERDAMLAEIGRLKEQIETQLSGMRILWSLGSG